MFFVLLGHMYTPYNRAGIMNFFQCLILATIMVASPAVAVAGVADVLPLAEQEVVANTRQVC